MGKGELDYFFLKLQNKKLCVVLNGVWCSSVKHLILLKNNPNLDVIDVSEYCFISKPLHLVGPVSENVPKIKTPLVLMPFSAIETYLFIFSSVVRK